MVANRTIPLNLIEAKLGKEDDPLFWKSALSVLADEFLQRYVEEGKRRERVIVVGACSHWVRPHNSCWTATGGFAVPEGYKDSMPEFDWSMTLVFREQQWTPVQKLPGKNVKVFRVSIPTRTARHKQAAIHTRWLPGDETVLYGFRNLNGEWRCVAASDEVSRGRLLANS